MAKLNLNNVRVLKHIAVGTVYSEKRDCYYNIDWYLVCPLDKDVSNSKNHRRLWLCSCESCTYHGKENEKKQVDLMKAAGQSVPEEKGQMSCKHLMHLYQAARQGVIPSDYILTEEGKKLLFGDKAVQSIPVETIAQQVAEGQRIAFETAISNKVGMLPGATIPQLADLLKTLERVKHQEELKKSREFRKGQC